MASNSSSNQSKKQSSKSQQSQQQAYQQAYQQSQSGYEQPLPPQYPPAFRAQPSQSSSTTQETQFHHYQPTPQRQAASPSRHPITAPFQIPRLAYPWPIPGSQPGAQQAGNVPIDPRLLNQAGSGGAQGGQAQGQWYSSAGGNGGNGGWPTTSG